jgi:hypothetical protein
MRAEKWNKLLALTFLDVCSCRDGLQRSLCAVNQLLWWIGILHQDLRNRGQLLIWPDRSTPDDLADAVQSW